MTQRVGFIGVGTMGKYMAINCAAAGFTTYAYHYKPEKISDLEKKNIVVADSVAKVAHADIIILALPSDDAVRSIFYDEKLVEALDETKTVIDCGTTSLELTEQLYSESKNKGFGFVDCPMTGSKLKAEAGTLMFMVGGADATIDAVTPVLESMSERIVRCGGPMQGQRAKFALNMAQALLLESYLECIVFARKLGVSMDAIEEILENSAAKTGVGSFKMPYIKKRDFDQHFMLKLMHKDLTFARAHIDGMDMKLPLAEKIKEIFGEALDRGHEDMCTIAKTLEEKNNVKLV